MENNFFISFDYVRIYVSTYITIFGNMIIPYLYLPQLYASGSALFLQNSLALSIYIDVVFTLSDRIFISVV